jgi:hypothetical protein
MNKPNRLPFDRARYPKSAPPVLRLLNGYRVTITPRFTRA